MEGTLADLCAGWAVGRGALHAGELQKRSEWRRKYNARFFVLTCDELAWFPAPRTNELTCSSWRFTAEGERRAITLHHQLSVGMKGDSLVIAGPGSAVIVKAASEAELHSWHASLTALVHGLRQRCAKRPGAPCRPCTRRQGATRPLLYWVKNALTYTM